ncbi:succinic semialdehyde dehydrogenase [Salarchaeum japonicum]|uniref:succinic semialdehyde dehydrogenase n=1 Tax=Salarchaeum japonicum TaxID=555573 RepID=UPI003C741261
MDTVWANPSRLAALREGITRVDDRPTFPVEAPFTGERIADVPACTEADVAAAVEQAREAGAAWAARPVDERAAVLSEFHDLVLDRQDDLLDLMQLETGKTRRDAFEEVLDVASTARHYATHTDLLASERRTGAFPGLTKAVVHHHPVGVVGLISPWNYPLTLAVSDALPALLAGNGVVLKPDESTTHTALLARDLLEDAGLPPGLLQVVSGDGADLGEPLISRVDHVGFTGSTAVGREVGALAGEHLTDVSLELGGKNPLLVLDDADPDEAAAGAVRASFANAGQLCISTERLYVHTDAYDDFVDAFVRETRNLALGAGFEYGPEMGSLQSDQQLEKVVAHVDDAVERGATVLAGGRTRPDLGPYFHEPTILEDVTSEMTLSSEETFGPVVALYEVDSVEEAVERANDSPYGLNASVWTSDTARGEHVAERIECGTVNVNEGYAAAWASIDAPMGGMKDSGVGRRHGDEGLLKYTESQTVATQRGARIDPGPLPQSLWASGLTLGLRALKRVAGWLP